MSGKEKKKWAKEHFRGYENILMPSFTPDLKELDEEGIRHDVRKSIEHGFFSVFCASVGLNPDERKRFIEIAVDEARDKILVGLALMGESEKECMQMLKNAEQAGCGHALVHPPFTFQAKSEEDFYGYIKQFVDGTDMAVVLWATDGDQYRHLHPSNVIFNAYDRLADLPNVIALKLMTTLEPATVFECYERLGDRLLVGAVYFSMFPILVKNYNMQWSGAWTVEALQSTEKPMAVDFFTALMKGNTEEAMKLYWQIKPAYQALLDLMAPMLPKGVHPFAHLKYYQWCVGGNGGLLREPWMPAERDFPLTSKERKAIKEAYRNIGITPDENDEVFIVGRVNYEKGKRPSDMPEKPMWSDK